jgi:hypothetical protein
MAPRRLEFSRRDGWSQKGAVLADAAQGARQSLMAGLLGMAWIMPFDCHFLLNFREFSDWLRTLMFSGLENRK